MYNLAVTNSFISAPVRQDFLPALKNGIKE